jgi:CRP/FNR family cyclic AMP-dependent transcriptional regulator
MGMNKGEFLGRVGLFHDLALRERHDIEGLFREQRMERDQVIFLEGDAAEYVYIVFEGKVKIVKQAPGGREMILEVFASGDVFGGATLLLSQHPATAVSMEPGVLLCLPRLDYLALLKRFSLMALQIIELLRQRLGDAHQVIQGLATEPVETRVARLLFKLADKTGVPDEGGIRLGLQLTRQDVADMVGCTLETAIRILSRWQRERLIKTQEGVITILNRQELRRLVEPG